MDTLTASTEYTDPCSAFCASAGSDVEWKRSTSMAPGGNLLPFGELKEESFAQIFLMISSLAEFLPVQPRQLPDDTLQGQRHSLECIGHADKNSTVCVGRDAAISGTRFLVRFAPSRLFDGGTVVEYRKPLKSN